MGRRILRTNLLILILNLALWISFYLVVDYAQVRDKNNIVKAGVVNYINELYYKKQIALRDIPEDLLTNETKLLVKEKSKQTSYTLGKIFWKDSNTAIVSINLKSHNIGKAYIESVMFLEKKYNVVLDKKIKAEYKTALNKAFTENLNSLISDNMYSHNLTVIIPEYNIYNNYIDIETHKLYQAEVKSNHEFSSIYLNNLGYIDYINGKETKK